MDARHLSALILVAGLLALPIAGAAAGGPAAPGGPSVTQGCSAPVDFNCSHSHDGDGGGGGGGGYASYNCRVYVELGDRHLFNSCRHY